MRNKFVRWGAALAALMLAAPAVLAAETELSLSGVGALRYVHHEGSGSIPGYAYDADADDRFMVNQLRFSAVAKSGENTSTHATLVLGEDAQANQSSGLGGGAADLEEMYVEHKLTNDLTLVVGKFATWQGKEVINPKENTNISRGLLYQNTEAFTHTGAAVKYQINKQVGIWGGAVNGWDVVVDNNSELTIIVRADLSFLPDAKGKAKLTGGVNVYFGSQEPGNNAMDTTSIDATFSYEVSKEFSIAAQVIQGTTKDGVMMGEDASWLGIGIWPTYTMNKFTLGIRIETLDDSDNARIGATIPPTATGVNYMDIAFTPAYDLADNVKVRAEIRLTTADEDVYMDADGMATDSNMTLSFETVWTF